jgi:hypothetical protein
VVTEPSLLMRSGALCDDLWSSARLSEAGFFAVDLPLFLWCTVCERSPASAMMIDAPRRG